MSRKAAECTARITLSGSYQTALTKSIPPTVGNWGLYTNYCCLFTGNDERGEQFWGLDSTDDSVESQVNQKERWKEFLESIYKPMGLNDKHWRLLTELVEGSEIPWTVIFESSWRTDEVPEDFRATKYSTQLSYKKGHPGIY